MLEVERKYRVLNKEKLRRQLKQLGAKFVARKTQVDTYYSPPHESFLGKEKYLRVREIRYGKKVKARFEYHLPITKFAGREYEIEVSNIHTLYYILQALKFKPEIVVKKKREHWVWRGVNIEIDQIRHLGNFVELEVMGKGQRAALQKIDAVAKILGFTKVEDTAYMRLLLKKQRPAVWRKYYGKNDKK